MDAVRWMDKPSDARKCAGADPLPDTFGNRHRALTAGIGQNHGKLVAAEPRRDVGFAGAAADDRRRLDERLAASQMPVCVVHLLETVEVEKQQRQRPATAGRAFRLRDGGRDSNSASYTGLSDRP